MRLISFIAAALVLSACSGSGEGADGGRSVDSTLRVNLGTSSRNHIVQTAQDALLTRYGYRLDRNVITGEDVRMETSWKDVNPLPDEEASGIAFARLRIMINARPRSRAGGGATTFSARMIAEVSGKPNPMADWAPVSMTPERRAYFSDIADYLENEFKGGVR